MNLRWAVIIALLANTSIADTANSQAVIGQLPPVVSNDRDVRWLEDRDWFTPLIADPKPPAMTFGFPLFSDQFEFSQEPGRRLTWDVSAGREIPIVYVANYAPSTVQTGRWGLGLWVALSFHVLEELGKDPSNPIINTDYRFSLATVKFRRVLTATGVNDVRYFDLKADVWHHESTHLGDEFVLGAQKNVPGFERINVSYEFWDVAGSYERRAPAGEDAYRRYVVRAGLIGVWPYAQGYYSDHTLDIDSRRIAHSKRNLEPYFQAEYWSPHPAGENAAQGRRFAPFVSADVRYKTVYDYRKLSDDQPEDKQWSMNVLVGFRTPSEGTVLSVKDIYFRFYHGVNPHGQLRNQRDYTTFGLGVNFTLGQLRRR